MARPTLRTRGQRLRAARKRRFPSARAAAIAFGIPVSTYGAHERAQARGGRDFGPHEAQQYARRLGVTTEWLLTGYHPSAQARPQSTIIVRIQGYMGLDGEVHIYKVRPENLQTMELPPLVTDTTVGLLIRGDALGPAFADWVLIYDDLREPVTPDLIGAVCVVALANGRVVIRRLMEGDVAGRYNLIFQVPPDIRDVAVLWAARVKALVRAQVRRSEKAAASAPARQLIPPAQS